MNTPLGLPPSPPTALEKQALHPNVPKPARLEAIAPQNFQNVTAATTMLSTFYRTGGIGRDLLGLGREPLTKS